MVTVVFLYKRQGRVLIFDTFSGLLRCFYSGGFKQNDNDLNHRALSLNTRSDDNVFLIMSTVNYCDYILTFVIL